MESLEFVFTLWQALTSWALANLPLVLASGLVALLGLILLRIRRRGQDRAERAFRQAGVKADPRQVRVLREQIAKMALDNEFRIASDDTRQANELAALDREKTRIIGLVRSTPAVVKEVGQALHQIEQAYEQGVHTVKSDQAREGLRLTAEKQINEVLASMGRESDLPKFRLESNRPVPLEARQPRRTDNSL